MHRKIRWSVVMACALMLAATALPASADHGTRPSRNLEALGHSPHPAEFFGPPAWERNINSDIAFWGDLAIHGNYDGFRIIDISNPNSPQEIVWQHCNGDQGDIVVWENIVVRAWNSPAPAPNPDTGEPGRTCDGQPVTPGFEGVHIFDISNPADPVLVGDVELPCGSHTLTTPGVTGTGNLIVWSNNSSSSGCVDGTRANDDPVGDFMDIMSVPLDDPGSAVLLRREKLAGPTTDVRTGCHDAGVILGSVNKAACASADTVNVWDVGANSTPGGAIQNPELLFTIFHPEVGTAGTNGRWHSAAFTWDGEVLILGWEPGGGAAPECEASDPAVDKSMFFYDADTGDLLGMWTLPRPQGPTENCTIHNYNVIPAPSGRDLVVGGHYQAGTWVTNATNPSNPTTLAFADPPPIDPPNLGGAWSSYWYNDVIYESEIQTGLNLFRLTTSGSQGVTLDRLNPQTQEFSLP